MHQAGHGGGAAHVPLHLFHAVGGLQADAAGVEGNALADQCVGLVALLAAVVLQNDDAARLVAALGYREERAGAEFAQFLLVQHFELDALVGLAQLPGLIGEEGRVADVRRQVAQVAGEGHAGGDRRGLAGGTLDAGLFGLVAEQDDLLQCTRFGLLALELVEHVLAVGNDLHQQACAGIAVAPLDLHVLHGESSIATTQILDDRQRCIDHFAPLAAVEFIRLAGADQQYPLGLEARQAVQQQRLSRLALDVAPLERSAERASAGAVHALCDAAELAVLAERQDQGGGLLGGGFGAFDNKFHDVVSPRQRVGFAG